MKKPFLVLCGLLIGATANAYDFAGFTVTGEANFDYSYLSSGDNAYPMSSLMVTPHNQYHFQQAQMLLKKSTDEFSFTARLGYWPTGYTLSDNTSTSTANLGMLEQLEMHYKIRPDLSIGFGRLATTMGFESFFKSENVFYTTTVAYLGLAPGYAEGIRLAYTPGDYLAVNVSSYNQSTYNRFGDDYTATKTTEVSATGTAGPVLWYAGHYFGVDKETVTENSNKSYTNIYATYNITENLAVSAIYDNRTKKVDNASEIVTQSWTGQASYIWGKHQLGLRYQSITGAEHLDALNGTTGAFFGNTEKVQIFGFVDKIKVTENLLAYLEYRHDIADDEVFVNSDNEPTKSGHIITLGAIAHF